MQALITGATGFIGRELVKRLDRPHVLSRNPDRARQALGDVTAFPWDPMAGPPPAAAFAGVEVVFHLAGEPVAQGRWDTEKKRRIRDSRIVGTRHLVDGLEALETRPRVLVSASAVGWYGDRSEDRLRESTPPADDFLADVCVEWEREARRAETLGMRVVTMRTGVVIGKGGGAMAEMLLPFKLGVGGVLGNGRQWMPWISLADQVGLYLHAAGDETLRGPLNAVGPEPARNTEFTKALGRVLKRPTILPLPQLALYVLKGPVARVVLASQRVIAEKAVEHGYEFQHPDVESALRDAV